MDIALVRFRAALRADANRKQDMIDIFYLLHCIRNHYFTQTISQLFGF